MVFDYPDFDLLSSIGFFTQEIDIRPYIDTQKPLIFFASHSHPDHFNPRIKDILNEIVDSSFVFSDDVLNIFPDFSRGSQRYHPVKPGDIITIDKTRIAALPSTDIGVSYFIEHNENHIFFPGDLALWLWDDLDQETREEIKEIFRDTIAYVKQRRTDILFVVVEPNLRDVGWGGAIDAVETLNPSLTVPIHLRQQYSIIYEFKKGLTRDSKVFSYRRTGDYYDWEKKTRTRGNRPQMTDTGLRKSKRKIL